MDGTPLRVFKADMHIHSCLSPCADVQMSPKRIVDRCCERGLDIIAICDHNSAENTVAAMRVGIHQGLTVLPGLEICSREEVHILALFEDPEQATVMQAFVYAHLIEKNNPELFGDQWVVNEVDEVQETNTRLLIGATQLDVRTIVDKIHSTGGLSIASHVDRPAFGIIGQLGFIPPDLELDGVEISRRMSIHEARETIAGIEDLPCVTSSDAHYLDDIGKVHTLFRMPDPTVEEIRLALKGEKGRRILETSPGKAGT